MLTIRKTKQSDLAKLARIYKAVYDAEDNGEEWSVKQARALLDFYFKARTSLCLTAVHDGAICGAFLSYVKPWWDGKCLAPGEIFIHPDYQGRKIGTGLYLAMMKCAKKKGCSGHELVAYEQAARWYGKIGMRETSLKHMGGSIDRVIHSLEK